MQITNKQKIYGAVLTLGAAAFVIDRIYFTPPAAMAITPAEQAARSDTKVDAGVETTNTSEGIIAAKLRAISPIDWDHLANAFSPMWISSAQPGGSHSEFAMKHKLSAVLATHGGGVAIVNGSMVRVGEVVDGFTLISVSRTGAVFGAGAVRISLALEQR